MTEKRKDENVKNTEMGRIELTTEQIKKLPALMGEVDPLKALQLLPGVQSAGEGNAGLDLSRPVLPVVRGYRGSPSNAPGETRG